MPCYELALVLRTMPRSEIVSTLKRTTDAIFVKGGIVRKLESLGNKTLPYKIRAHGFVHKEGNFFTVEFDTAPKMITELREEFGRDIDIIKRNIFKVDVEEEFDCTLHEECLPPAYRKEVQEMINIAQKKQKPKFNYNSGLDFYPFQK